MDTMNKICEKFSGEANVPIYRELGEIIMEMIEQGELSPGERLPPIRRLAAELKVNNSTVVNAYKLLESKFYAYSITGSGTYVSQLNQSIYRAPTISGEASFAEEEPESVLDNAINFANANTSADLFPVSDFKLLFNTVLDRDKGDAFGYEERLGYLPLREALCGYMEGFGVKASAEHVQIISGAQQGIDIIAKAMLRPNDNVIVEAPTYYGAVGSFLSRGAVVNAVDIADDGVDIDRLEQLVRARSPQLVYTMPSFQTPTCVSYSLEKKRALIELANKYNFYIIEEDNQSDFCYGGRVASPLKTLDYKNRVIYIKSFSKILMPGLRLGFMILPKAVLKAVISAKSNTDIDTSGFIQRAFELFIKSGAMDRHITKMRGIYAKRYECMGKELLKLKRHGFFYLSPQGGLNFWLHLPQNLEVETFFERLLHNGVIVTPGAVFSYDGKSLPNIRISFAGTDEKKITEGIRIIVNNV